jgi:hypothetical protein
MIPGGGGRGATHPANTVSSLSTTTSTIILDWYSGWLTAVWNAAVVDSITILGIVFATFPVFGTSNSFIMRVN